MSKKPGQEKTLRDIASLTCDPDNARVHDKRNLEAIAASLKAYGQQKPIVVKGNVVHAGNGTLEAARTLGWSEIWVVESELEGAALRAYAIADNRTAELAEWDKIILTQQLRDMESPSRIGWSDEDVRRLMDNTVTTEAMLGAYSYSVIVDCLNEQHQKQLLDRFRGEQLKCRALISQ